MNNQQLETLLNIIDSRIRKIIKEENYLYRYTAKVVQVNSNDSADVKIYGYTGDNDTTFTTKIQCQDTLNVGDTVYIDCVGGDLQKGFITYKKITL